MVIYSAIYQQSACICFICKFTCQFDGTAFFALNLFVIIMYVASGVTPNYSIIKSCDAYTLGFSSLLLILHVCDEENLIIKLAVIIFTYYYSGLLEPPTDHHVEQVTDESVKVSWSPPFTLSGVPILHYTVYITSNGLTETLNTSQPQVTLDRPCSTTTYQISAWNDVGEGNKSSSVKIERG